MSGKAGRSGPGYSCQPRSQRNTVKGHGVMVEAPARHPGDPPRRRECLVEVAMQEAAYATLTSQLHAYFETGQVADAYTNNLFYIGTRATGGKGGNHAFVGPDWKGTPKDVIEHRVPTDGWVFRPLAGTQGIGARAQSGLCERWARHVEPRVKSRCSRTAITSGKTASRSKTRRPGNKNNGSGNQGCGSAGALRRTQRWSNRPANPQAQATPGAPQLIMSWFQPPAPRFVWSASYIDRRRIASQSSVPIADMRDRPTNY